MLVSQHLLLCLHIKTRWDVLEVTASVNKLGQAEHGRKQTYKLLTLTFHILKKK